MDERFKEITDIIGQIENKLDLMLDLINAKNNENWDLVDEIHAKMDEMRSKKQLTSVKNQYILITDKGKGTQHDYHSSDPNEK